MPDLAREVSADGLPVLARRELREAGGELSFAPAMEIGRVEIRRCRMELVEERARQRQEHDVPAQQAEQRIDQRVLDVVNGRIRLSEERARRQLHRADRRPSRER